MQGFKSFADRTKMTFESGVTAIVGPNGSGKSNTSDAIKWVFGEQSVKSLRGAKMEDVIFDGTHTRPASGFASVSLYIDNSDREIDVDADEVIITRKLFRNGDSEYRINGNNVRLKDINEIFMDTGLGRDGYSIIEQGKISDIVEGKNNQRREIFEEAAGISKFRYRKIEAERDLSKAEENLVRLRDIYSELESRIKPLKEQSEKAKKYTILVEEKKSLEISLWNRRLEQLKEKMQVQEDKILIASTEYENAVRKLSDIERQIEENEKLSQEANIYIEHKRSKIAENQELIHNSELSCAVKENDINHNTLQIDSYKKELEVGNESGSGFDAVIDEKKSILDQIDAKAKEISQVLFDLNKNMEHYQKLFDDYSATISSLTQQKAELEDSIGKAQLSGNTSATLVTETLNRLEEIKQKSTGKNDSLIQAIEEDKKNKKYIEELQEKLSGVVNTINGCNLKIENKNKDYENLLNQQNDFERMAGTNLQKAQMIADMVKNMDGYNASVRSILKSAENGQIGGIVGTVSSLIRVDSKYSLAIETALGQSLQNVVTTDETSAKRAISLLKQNQSGRATFLPLTNVTGNPIQDPKLSGLNGFIGIASSLVGYDAKYKNVIDYSLGRIIISEDLNAATSIAKITGYKYRIVTLDGQLVNPGGSLTGGYVNRSVNLLSRKNEIEKLNTEAREYAQKAKDIGEKLHVLQNEIHSVQAILDGARGEEKTINDDLLIATTEQKRIEMVLNDNKRLNEESLSEIQSLTNRIEEFKTKESTSENLVKELSVTLSNVTNEISSAEQNKSDADEKLKELTAEHSQKLIENAEIQKDLQSAQEDLAQANSDKNNYAERTNAIREKMESLEKANEDALAEINNLKKVSKEAEENVQILNGDITDAISRKSSYELAEKELRDEEKNEISRRESASSEKTRLKEQQDNLTSENESIVSKLWDEYELTRTEAGKMAIVLEDPQASQKRLTELKYQIRSLGNVNLAAIEEYEEVSERYETYTVQITDIEKSKNQLLEMINNLSSEMSTIFEDKFSKINEQFGKIFTELFNGGNAMLSLADPSAPLTSDIEIEVHPPGKVIKNLMKLSGGEKSMVAICIYFAILKVSPAPFVLMDEIESALDDVNVIKFVNYMRHVTDKTQFICITHKRGTMEGANVLYGVTMEEKGVSKILKLNVSEIGSKFVIEED